MQADQCIHAGVSVITALSLQLRLVVVYARTKPSEKNVYHGTTKLGTMT